MPTLPALRIRLKRHADASASITLTRDDNSVTWQRQPGKLALVFPQHDLTHYAVEQTLHYNFAFYGLVADGWEISDFAKPWARGPIPQEAWEVEMLVGLFDGIRPDRELWNAAEFNRQLRQLAADSKYGKGMTPRLITEEELTSVRAKRDELLGQWHATGPGDALELQFNRV